MTMARLAQLEGSAESVKKHQATVLVSLKEAPRGTLFVTGASKRAHEIAVKVSRSRKSSHPKIFSSLRPSTVKESKRASR